MARCSFLTKCALGVLTDYLNDYALCKSTHSLTVDSGHLTVRLTIWSHMCNRPSVVPILLTELYFIPVNVLNVIVV